MTAALIATWALASIPFLAFVGTAVTVADRRSR